MRVRGRYRANNPETVPEAALAGVGIALLPGYLCSAARADGRFVRVLPAWTPQASFGPPSSRSRRRNACRCGATRCCSRSCVSSSALDVAAPRQREGPRNALTSASRSSSEVPASGTVIAPAEPSSSST